MNCFVNNPIACHLTFENQKLVYCVIMPPYQHLMCAPGFYIAFLALALILANYYLFVFTKSSRLDLETLSGFYPLHLLSRHLKRSEVKYVYFDKIFQPCSKSCPHWSFSHLRTFYCKKWGVLLLREVEKLHP